MLLAMHLPGHIELWLVLPLLLSWLMVNLRGTGDGDGIPRRIAPSTAPGGLVFRAYTLDRASPVLLSETVLPAEEWRAAMLGNPTLPDGLASNERFMFVGYHGDSGERLGTLIARRVDGTNQLLIEGRWR